MNRVCSRAVTGILLGMVLFFGSCGSGLWSPNTSSAPVDADADADPVEGSRSAVPEYQIYVITPEGLSPLSPGTWEDEAGILNQSVIPWVNQLRVENFIFLDDSLYFTVNGLGIGRIAAGYPLSEVRFSESCEHFQDRTLGSARVYNDSILCQFYGDRVFSEEPVIGGSPLVRYYPTADGNAFSSLEVLTPEEGAGPGELVEFSVLDGEWYAAWKEYTSAGITFSYTAYNPAGSEVRFLESDEYRRALLPVSLSTAPEVESKLCRAVLDKKAGADDSVYIISWSFSDGRPAEDWYFGELSALAGGRARVVFLNGFSGEGEQRLLDSETGVLWSFGEEGRGLTSRLLPLPPPGFCYTNLAIYGDTLLLSWEEQSFPSIGAAGLLVQKLKV